MSTVNRPVAELPGRTWSGREAIACCLLAIVCMLPSAGCKVVARGQNVAGVRQFQQGGFPGALERFQQALYNDPSNADALYNLAATYHRMGTLYGNKSDFDQAESYYNQCLDKHADHVSCYRGLAVMLVEQGRNEEAFRLLEGWVTRSPTLPDTKIELARLFEEFGNRDAAKQHLLDALAIDAYDPRALAALGQLHEASGDSHQALSVYQRSLWNDRFQPELAARIAALQSALAPAPLAAPTNGTRTVIRSAPVVR